jgi:hypothetical protein
MNILTISYQNGINILKHVKVMENSYKVSSIYFEQEYLVLILSDQKYLFKIIEISDKLAKADEKERNNFQLQDMEFIGQVLTKICPLMGY